MLFALAATIFPLSFYETALADQASLPDDHAPITVTGDHTHKAGEWMLSYRYGFIKMDGNRDGTDDLTSVEVLADFTVAPLDMTMEMHMFGLMYGVTDRLTLMGMGYYVRKSMNHVTCMDKKFEVESKGLGDTKLLGLLTIHDSGGSEESRLIQTFRMVLDCEEPEQVRKLFASDSRKNPRRDPRPGRRT